MNFRVADLDALLEALKEEGVEIDPHREDYDYGRFAWIMDPEGNRIELWEPPAGVETGDSGHRRFIYRAGEIPAATSEPEEREEQPWQKQLRRRAANQGWQLSD